MSLLLRVLSALLLVAALWGVSPAADAVEPSATRVLMVPGIDENWLWPVEGRRAVVHPFRAPAHDYASGHRGMDVVATQSEPAAIYAPADGIVAFRGVVVDRPLLTIDHGSGLISTLEPVMSELPAGSKVTAGDVVGTASVGGHSARGTIHVGVRLHGVYINPQLLFGGVPRAILLPCGASGC